MEYEKKGYLLEEYRISCLKDRTKKIYPAHCHDFYKVILFISGDVIYNIEGKDYVCKPNDLILVGKNEIHRVTVSDNSDYERYVLWLSEEFLSTMMSDKYKLSDCFSQCSSFHVNVIHLKKEFAEKLRKLISSAYSYKESDSSDFAKLNLLNLMIQINRLLSDQKEFIENDATFDTKAVKACRYINNHLMEDLSLDSLSEKCGTTKYHLSRIFKKSTGYTLHEYIIEKRIRYVEKLHEEGKKYNEACVLAGFKDYSMFVRTRSRYNKKREQEFYDNE